MKLSISFGVLLWCSVTFAEKARFDNYRVYHVAIENEIQLRALKELSENSDSVSFENQLFYLNVKVY